MRSPFLFTLVGFLALHAAGFVNAAGRTLEVHYDPSTLSGELQLGVTYTLWIPEGVTTIRGIIVHQHGCGSGACKAGATAAFDLHWQALAKKWDCALLGPSYEQEDKQNCRLWCDPRNGSAKTFLNALRALAAKSKHPEMETVPWCLWGHSGGGFWASLMQTSYLERIVAIWLRSGTAFSAWEKGEVAKPVIPEAAYAIPMMCNTGAKEKGDKRFDGAWTSGPMRFPASGPSCYAHTLPHELSTADCLKTAILRKCLAETRFFVRSAERGITKEISFPDPLGHPFDGQETLVKGHKWTTPEIMTDSLQACTHTLDTRYHVCIPGIHRMHRNDQMM